MSPVNTDAARSAQSISHIAVLAAVTLTVIGMMLVVGGVLVTGLFMTGAVLIAIGMIAFAAAGVLHVRDAAAGAEAEGRANRAAAGRGAG